MTNQASKCREDTSLSGEPQPLRCSCRGDSSLSPALCPLRSTFQQDLSSSEGLGNKRQLKFRHVMRSRSSNPTASLQGTTASGSCRTPCSRSRSGQCLLKPLDLLL